MPHITIDATDYEVSEGLAVAFAHLARRLDETDAQIRKLTGGADASASKRVERRVREHVVLERAALERIATQVLGDGAQLGGLTDREVQEQALAKHFGMPLNLRHKSDAYVAGTFDAVFAREIAAAHGEG